MKMLKEIKCTLERKVYNELDNLDNVCVEELGEVIDMIKDLSEAMYYCSIVHAMEEGDEETEKLAIEMAKTHAPTGKIHQQIE